MNKSLVLIIFIRLSLTFGQEACQNYYNQPGVCVSLVSCPSLSRLNANPYKSFWDRIILNGSFCSGFRNAELVCCTDSGNVATPTTTTRKPSRINTTRRPSNVRSSSLLPVPGSGNCGLHVVDKIHGGNKTAINEHPWLALLEYTWISGGKSFNCGGFLINERYVVTAGHCIKSIMTLDTPILSKVRLGEWNYKTTNDCQVAGATTECSDPPQDFEIEKMILHPAYQNLKTSNGHNDIGLIRLSRPARMSTFVRPICLPLSEDLLDRTEYHGVKFTVAGWGYTENNVLSDTKLKVEVNGVNQGDCQEAYNQRRKTIVEKQICAGGEAGKDSCGGDSGGPLMMRHSDAEGKNYWYAAGIVSYGPDLCGTENVPGVYTRVGAYMDWILEQIQA